MRRPPPRARPPGARPEPRTRRWAEAEDLDVAVADATFGAEWRRTRARLAVPDECLAVGRMLARGDAACAPRWRNLEVSLPRALDAVYADGDVAVHLSPRGDLRLATRIAAPPRSPKVR